MTGFNSPNYTQVPNDLFDNLLSEMGEAELRIILWACRQTFGYHRTSDEISWSQFMKATGLSKNGVYEGIAAAIEHGILKEVGTGRRGVKRYGLVIHHDMSSQMTTTGNPRLPDVERATGHLGLPTKEKKETAKKSARRQSQKTPIAKVANEYDDVPRDTRWGIIQAWCSNLTAQPVGAFNDRYAKGKENHATAADLHRAGYTEAQVADFVREKQADGYWRDKTLTLQKVAELLPGWAAGRKKQKAANGHLQPAPAFEDTQPAEMDWLR